MSSTLQARAAAMADVGRKVAALESELKALEKTHAPLRVAHDEAEARAALDRKTVTAPPGYAEREARIVELRRLLPKTRELLNGEQYRFRIEVLAAFREKQAALETEQTKSVGEVYANLAGNVLRLAGIIGPDRASEMLAPTEHGDAVRARLPDGFRRFHSLSDDITSLDGTRSNLESESAAQVAERAPQILEFLAQFQTARHRAALQERGNRSVR